METSANLSQAPVPKGGYAGARRDLAGFEEVPFISKRELREGFPGNFLRPGQSLERLLEQGLIELEYTSGTSEEQLQVFFRRGWWEDQEERTFRRNPFLCRALDNRPDARRATLTTPACNEPGLSFSMAVPRFSDNGKHAVCQSVAPSIPAARKGTGPDGKGDNRLVASVS